MWGDAAYDSHFPAYLCLSLDQMDCVWGSYPLADMSLLCIHIELELRRQLPQV